MSVSSSINILGNSLKIHVTGVQFGIITGILAVAAGTFFEVRPPEAYGICMACHGRDLINWILNSQLGASLMVSPVSTVVPLLTSVGVLFGASIGAVSNGEFRWRNPDNPVKTFIYGIVVMNFALLAAGCSIRLLLRAATGELLGLIGVVAMAIGVVLGTFWLRWRATR